MFRRILLILGSTLLLSATAAQAAQLECAAIVTQALTLIDANCTGTGRNQACHGYLNVEADGRADADNFSFALGEIADLAQIATLRTTPFDETTGEWGVAFLRVQANLPDELPGANVTLLLMGDSSLEDMGTEDARPMQAFRLRTGLSGTTCADVPADGLLVQTPHGVGRISLNINGADVSLGSTVFFEAHPGEVMTISTLEGSAEVTSADETQTALPGEQVTVPMTLALRPAGAPSGPTAYDGETMRTLPLSLLERPVVMSSDDPPEACDCAPTAEAAVVNTGAASDTVTSDVTLTSDVTVTSGGETLLMTPAVTNSPSQTCDPQICTPTNPPTEAPAPGNSEGSGSGNCGNGNGGGSGQSCPPSSPAGGGNSGNGGRGNNDVVPPPPILGDGTGDDDGDD